MGVFSPVSAQAGLSVQGDVVSSLSGALVVPSRPLWQETIGEAVCSLEMPGAVVPHQHSWTNIKWEYQQIGIGLK